MFQLSGGSTLSFFFIHRNITVAGTGWSPPVTAERTLTSSVTFSTSAAHLTSVWLAVMANASYGTFQVQFQWQWWIQSVSHGGHVKPAQFGAWSPPVSTSSTSEQPTTFYPAPLVRAVATSGGSGASGTNYTVGLRGNVSGTHFRMVVETPTGTELNSVCQTTPTIAGSYNASIPLAYFNGTGLPPGNYLVHILNAGGAIVVFEKVTVT